MLAPERTANGPRPLLLPYGGYRYGDSYMEGEPLRHPSTMTPAERRIAREAMGLTVQALAEALNQHVRTIYRWEGAGEISASNAAAFGRLLDYTDQAADALTEQTEPGGEIITYRSDEDFQATEPQAAWPTLPAQWHRAVARRAARRIPGATVTYRE